MEPAQRRRRSKTVRGRGIGCALALIPGTARHRLSIFMEEEVSVLSWLSPQGPHLLSNLPLVHTSTS